MKNSGKYGLALAALFGLLLPACGGGGSANSSTYISVRQFETGTKKFLFLATPSVEVYATSFPDDSGSKGLTEAMKEGVKKLAGGGTEMSPPGLQESTGTVVRGVCSTGDAGHSNCLIEYCVEGGETGRGYMVIYFAANDMSAGVVNAIGALLPDQVIQFANGSVNTSSPDQTVLLSANGLTLAVTLDFSSGLATLSLTAKGGGGDDDFSPIVYASRPFLALDR